MNARMSKAERGVWGRRATDEERTRLQQFLANYRRQADELRSSDESKLRALVRQYAVSLGMSPDAAEQFHTARTRRDARIANIRQKRAELEMLSPARKRRSLSVPR